MKKHGRGNGQLTPKQRRFVDEYLIDLNGAAAARRAGYSERIANRIATENMSKPVISAAIAEAQAARSERTAIDADRVFLELARIGLSDIRRLMSWDGNRVTFRPSDELTEAEAAAIAAVQSETITTLKDDGTTTTKTKLTLRLWDKAKALDLMGKHLGVPETLDVSHHHHDHIEELTDEELRAEIRRLAGSVDSE